MFAPGIKTRQSISRRRSSACRRSRRCWYMMTPSVGGLGAKKNYSGGAAHAAEQLSTSSIVRLNLKVGSRRNTKPLIIGIREHTMTDFDWQPFLEQWSRDILNSPEAMNLPQGAIESGWLGLPPASE